MLNEEKWAGVPEWQMAESRKFLPQWLLGSTPSPRTNIPFFFEP